MSYRPQLIAIISIAQHASPNVTGQIDDRRAHCTTFSTVVVRTGISMLSAIVFAHGTRDSGLGTRDSTEDSPMTDDCQVSPFVSPVEHAFAPDVDVARHENGEEDDNLDESCPPEVPDRHSEGVQKRDLDVEQQEDHRHEVELDGMALAGVPHRR